MNDETHKSQETEPKDDRQHKTLLGTLLDLGASWTAHGLHAGKFTLENSARMLDKTAKAVEGFARDFEKNRDRGR